jgi:hypothetical protein
MMACRLMLSRLLPLAHEHSTRLGSKSTNGVSIAFRDVMLHECRTIAAKALRSARFPWVHPDEEW